MKKILLLSLCIVFSGFAEEFNVFHDAQGKMASPNEHEWGGFFQADLLYWSSYEDGLEYSYQQDSLGSTTPGTNPNTIPVIEGGRFTKVGGEWKPGLRVEGGAHTPFDDWDMYARWIWLSGEMSSSTNINSLTTANIAPIWLGAGFQTGYAPVLASSATWNLHYNVVNLACKRAYFSSPRLGLSIHSGLQGASIRQQFQANYSGGSVVNDPTYFRGENNFQAIGLFSAFGMSWILSDQWKLLGKFQGSLNFGKYNLSQKNVSAIFDLSGSAPYGLHDNLQQTCYRTRFAYEAELGAEWEWTWKNKTKLALQLMYNLSEWLHLNQLRKFTFVNSSNSRYFYSANGNLGFQGFSFATRVDY